MFVDNFSECRCSYICFSGFLRKIASSLLGKGLKDLKIRFGRQLFSPCINCVYYKRDRAAQLRMCSINEYITTTEDMRYKFNPLFVLHMLNTVDDMHRLYCTLSSVYLM